jgi:hypothetical protein
MREAVERGQANRELVRALGLLGDVATMGTLLDLLAEESLAEGVSMALETVTGAGLVEEVIVRDVHEDELFEEERQRIAGDGGSPAGGGYPTAMVARPSRDPEAWREWWAANRARFTPGVRYRSGAPSTPGALIECLASDVSTREARQLAHHELTVRYAARVPFDTRLRVLDQERALDAYSAWLRDQGRAFRAGNWYYGGRPDHRG